MDNYCVVGNPIEQSKSPQIHALFAEQTGEVLTYVKKLIELGQFAQDAEVFFADGGLGMNVTAPFKEDALAFAATMSKRAELAGAANTLARLEDGNILADNTDGEGLVWDLSSRLGWEIANKRLLILGAGGATRGVIYSLLSQRPAELTIANRTASKAEFLAEKFAEFGSISGCGFAQLDGHYDLIINATSASLTGELPAIDPVIFRQTQGVYDMVYAKELTVFLAWAKESGAEQISDGLGMLVGQAAESFRIWRQREPNRFATFNFIKKLLEAS